MLSFRLAAERGFVCVSFFRSVIYATSQDSIGAPSQAKSKLIVASPVFVDDMLTFEITQSPLSFESPSAEDTINEYDTLL